MAEQKPAVGGSQEAAEAVAEAKEDAAPVELTLGRIRYESGAYGGWHVIAASEQPPEYYQVITVRQVEEDENEND